MNRQKAQELYSKTCNALAYIEIKRPNGDLGIGSCFHIGEGVFITARHVIERNKILKIKITEPVGVQTKEFLTEVLQKEPDDTLVENYTEVISKIKGNPPLFKHFVEDLQIESGPFFPEDDTIDVAIFKILNLHPSVPSIPLGLHYDDWVYRGFWHLSNALILGFPPIPMVNEPHLIAAKAEIHTYVVPRHCPNVHFILSSTPRGGFSGGVAIQENGHALGVITSSFVENNLPEQLGFLCVLSVEPILVLLKKHNLTPQNQKDLLEELFAVSKNKK